MVEVWKDIQGYEGLYQVSNQGRVYSCRSKKVLKPTPSSTTGYIIVGLTKDKRTKLTPVHRLVATAFIENPKNAPVVNHIDANRANNCVENLEWCTHKENAQHSIALGRFSKMMYRDATIKRKLTIREFAEQISFKIIGRLTRHKEYECTQQGERIYKNCWFDEQGNKYCIGIDDNIYIFATTGDFYKTSR